MTADLQARRRLGLTATLVREDGREADVFSLIGPKRFDAPWKDIEAQGYIAPADCVEVRVSLPDGQRMAYAVSEPEERYRLASCSDAKLPVVETAGRAARRRADARHRAVPRPAPRGGRAARRRGHHRRDDGQGAPAPLRRLPHGRDHDPRRQQGRELLHRPARGERRDPDQRHLRLAPGGGPAPRPRPAAQGRRAHRALLHDRRRATRSTPTSPRTASASSPSRATPTGSSTPTTSALSRLRSSGAIRATPSELPANVADTVRRGHPDSIGRRGPPARRRGRAEHPRAARDVAALRRLRGRDGRRRHAPPSPWPPSPSPTSSCSTSCSPTSTASR